MTWSHLYNFMYFQVYCMIIKETLTQHSLYPFIYLRILDNQFYILIYAFKPMHSM